MSVANRLGLLLDLATLTPPAFKSELFARWCCEATMSLLAQETRAMNANLHLSPGVFLTFTPSIPGMEDLPRFNTALMDPPYPILGRSQPAVVVTEGKEVDVVVVIYEMVRNDI